MLGQSITKNGLLLGLFAVVTTGVIKPREVMSTVVAPLHKHHPLSPDPEPPLLRLRLLTAATKSTSIRAPLVSSSSMEPLPARIVEAICHQ